MSTRRRAMPLIMGMSVLLICQFLGELLARGLMLPVPGPVFGMVILLAGLMIRGKVPESLRLTGEGLLRYLTLLFVPASSEEHTSELQSRPHIVCRFLF